MEALRKLLERTAAYTEPFSVARLVAEEALAILQQAEEEMTAGVHYQQILTSRRAAWQKLEEVEQQLTALQGNVREWEAELRENGQWGISAVVSGMRRAVK